MTAIPTLCLFLKKTYSKCFFYFVRLFLAFIYVFYMYTIYLSFPYFNTEVISMSFTEHRLPPLRSVAFDHVFAGYRPNAGALISKENVEKYVACVCCVARRRSKPGRIEFCGWTWQKTSAYIFPRFHIGPIQRGFATALRWGRGEYSVNVFPMLHRPTIIRGLFSNSHAPELRPS